MDDREVLRQNLVDAARWQNEMKKRSRRFWIKFGAITCVLGIGAGAFAYNAIHEDEPQGSAGCDQLDIQVENQLARIIRFRPTVHVEGDASLSGMTYNFTSENDNNKFYQVSYADTGEHFSSFIDAAPGKYKITGITNYYLDNKIFGGLPLCEARFEFL